MKDFKGDAPFVFNPKDNSLLFAKLTSKKMDHPLIIGMGKLGVKMNSKITFGEFEMKEIESATGEFWSGFFQELTNKELISEISFSKASNFANGRATARYEILKRVILPENIAYLKPLSQKITGEKKKGGEKSMFSTVCSATFVEADRKIGRTYIKSMLTYLCKEFKQGMLEKFKKLKDFLISLNDFQSAIKRSKTETVEKGKNKKGKPLQVTTTIKATRPSQLASVYEYEREAVKELYESAWAAYDKVIEDFKSYKPEETKIASLIKRGKDVTNLTWNAKQAVLSKTKHRLKKSEEGQELTKTARIAEMTRFSSEVKDSGSYRKYVPKVHLIPIFPTGQYKSISEENKEEIFTSFIAFMQSTKETVFPGCWKLIQAIEAEQEDAEDASASQ
jgi:hypothetical protein